jgi:hypothetical protein
MSLAAKQLNYSKLTICTVRAGHDNFCAGLSAGLGYAVIIGRDNHFIDGLCLAGLLPRAYNHGLAHNIN